MDSINKQLEEMVKHWHRVSITQRVKMRHILRYWDRLDLIPD